MPSLVQNYRKRVVETRLEKFYSAFSQAGQLSIAEHGETNNWVLPNSGWTGSETKRFFETYYKPYLRLAKYCGTDVNKGCSYGWIDAHAAVVKFITEDGVSVGTVWGNALVFYVDVNAKQGPNKSGVDRFMFQLDGRSGSLMPYIWEAPGVEYDDNWNCKSRKCYMDVCKAAPADCAGLIRYDGWKIKDDYPIKF